MSLFWGLWSVGVVDLHGEAMSHASVLLVIVIFVGIGLLALGTLFSKLIELLSNDEDE